MNEPQNHYTKSKKSNSKITYYVIPFIQNSGKGKIEVAESRSVALCVQGSGVGKTEEVCEKTLG